jgi:hypothetical protein
VIEMDDHYRGHSIQIEQARDTLYAFVWRPGSLIEWGLPAVTATTDEGARTLLRRAHLRIDEDITRRTAAGTVGARK